MRKPHLLFALAWVAAGAGCAEPTPDELMSLAHQAIDQGEVRTAEIHLRNLLREAPDNAAARRLLGQVSLTQGDPAAAEAALRRALELGADPASVQLPLLQALLGQGRHEDVLAQLAAGPQLIAEDRVTAMRLAAAAHRGLNQPQEAEEQLRAALQIEPASAAVRTDLANLMLAQNRVDDARRFIVDVLADEPTFRPALLLRGMIEFMGRRLDDAEATLRQVVEGVGPQDESYLGAMSQLVEVLVAKGDLDQAGVVADQLIADYSRHPVAIVLKADLEIRAGELNSAQRRLEALIVDAPAFGPALRLLGIVNAEQGQVQQAQMYLQGALGQSSQDPRAALHLAKLHLDQEDVASARQVLTRLLQAQEPRSDALLFALAGRLGVEVREENLAAQFFEQSALMLSGDPQEQLAVAALYADGGQMERAQEMLRVSSASGSDSAWMATLGLALTQIQQREYDAADATLQQLIPMQPQAAWPLNMRGTVAGLRQDFTAARQHFTAALELDSSFAPALVNRARISTLEGRLDDADQDLRRALELEPANASALVALAELALGRRDYEQARQWLERAPESVARLRLEGAVASGEGRFEDAAAIFEQVFETQPSADNALQAFAAARRTSRPNPESALAAWVAEHPQDARVHFALGSSALQAGDHDEAIGHFEAVVRAVPEQAEALNNLAWLYGERGDDRAVGLAERAHAAAPDNPAVADTLGWLYVQSGDAAAGLPLLEQSHAAAPGNADIHYHWAIALAETGATDRAVTVLREVLAAHEDFADRADAERLLRELE